MKTLNCKVICGDTFKVLPTLEEGSIDLVITSPPYNVGKEYEEQLSQEEYLKWMKGWIKHIPRLLSEKGSFVLNLNDRVINGERTLIIPKLWLYCVEELGLHFIEMYIWNKQKMLPLKSDKRATDVFEYVYHFSKTMNFHFDHDPVRRPYAESSVNRMNYTLIKRWSRERGKEYTKRKKVKPHPLGALPKNLLDISSQIDNQIHTAVFPPELPEFFIKALTEKEDVILDPFNGSGTTGMVSRDNFRNYIGIDIDPEYCKISWNKIS